MAEKMSSRHEPSAPLACVFLRVLCVLGEKSLFQSVGDPCNGVFDPGHIEIDQQAQSFVCQPQIGEKLLLVESRDLRDRLDFYDYLVLDNYIGAKAHFKAGPFVNYGYRLLPCQA